MADPAAARSRRRNGAAAGRGAPRRRSRQSRSRQDGSEGHPEASTHLRFLSEDACGGAAAPRGRPSPNSAMRQFGLAPGTGDPGQVARLGAEVAVGRGGRPPGGPKLLLDRRASTPRTPVWTAASQTTPEGTPVRLAPPQSEQGVTPPSRTSPGPPPSTRSWAAVPRGQVRERCLRVRHQEATAVPAGGFAKGVAEVESELETVPLRR